MRRALFLALLFVAAGCEDDFTSPIDSRFPLTGTFSDTLIADGADTVTFTPGRTGATTVAICAEPGFNFDLEGEGETSTTPSNCERITFDAVAGESYTVVVRAVEGDGVYGGCWSTALVQCAPFEPVACAPPAATGDSALPAGYYSNAEGKTGPALLAALDRILCRTRALSYDNIRDSMYAIIEDPDNNDLLADIYLGRVATVNSRATAAAADFNAEHTWPQSKGAQAFPAMTDVHHLFPADEGANSRRSNLPFGVVAGTPTWVGDDPDGDGDVSKQGRDASGREVFEPRNAKKGDVARAIFYFYTRYNLRRPAGFTLENFIIEEPVLIQWAAADPPDAFERQRNSLAFRVQRNRNPFVDRPELIAAVGDWP